MPPYTGFAAVYDLFMDNVPYAEWADYVQQLLNKYGIKPGLLLELGCGTGKMARQLAVRGYDMIGIDNSEEMLQIAKEAGNDNSEEILYLCQDMREFELYGTVSAVISVCDSINYILTDADLLKVFRLVNNYLDPGGLFIFDLDTEFAYKEILGENTIAENREEGSFIWENTYYEEDMINEINLTLFIQENESKLFRKYEETHYRKAYTQGKIRQLIEEAGMEWVAVFDALTEKNPKKDSERIYIIAREKIKSKTEMEKACQII
jgi:SAM-dependent methyltransferase